VLSRYLSGANKPSSDNILVISQYLNVSPEWLLSSSDAPESSESSRHISSDKDKIIAVQEELIKNLQKQVMAQSYYIHALFKNLEEAKTESKERHAKGRKKTKKPKK
jgi:transcriptional regulator with XRE-family HTH domain